MSILEILQEDQEIFLDLILDMNRNSYLYIPLNTIGNWQIFNLIKINISSTDQESINKILSFTMVHMMIFQTKIQC